MATKTYVTKTYPINTYIPAQRGAYDHDLKHPGNQYVVDTRTTERVRAPVAAYTDYVGSLSKAELLKEYVHSPTMASSHKYAPRNHYDDSEPKYGLNYEKPSPPVSPNNYTHGYFNEEPIRTHVGQNYVQTRNTSGPNMSWQATGPPTTHHQLTTSTNNINEALGLLEESGYYSPRANPMRRGVLDDLSTRAQPVEPHRRYARPAFVDKRNDARSKFTDTWDNVGSHEATRRYNGSFMP